MVKKIMADKHMLGVAEGGGEKVLAILSIFILFGFALGSCKGCKNKSGGPGVNLTSGSTSPKDSYDKNGSDGSSVSPNPKDLSDKKGSDGNSVPPLTPKQLMDMLAKLRDRAKNAKNEVDSTQSVVEAKPKAQKVQEIAQEAMRVAKDARVAAADDDVTVRDAAMIVVEILDITRQAWRHVSQEAGGDVDAVDAAGGGMSNEDILDHRIEEAQARQAEAVAAEEGVNWAKAAKNKERAGMMARDAHQAQRNAWAVANKVAEANGGRRVKRVDDAAKAAQAAAERAEVAAKDS
jgi:hypothetical protein